MTILIAVTVWSAIVAFTIRSCQHLHECDRELHGLATGARGLRTKRRIPARRRREVVSSFGDHTTASVAG